MDERQREEEWARCYEQKQEVRRQQEIEERASQREEARRREEEREEEERRHDDERRKNSKGYNAPTIEQEVLLYQEQEQAEIQESNTELANKQVDKFEFEETLMIFPST